MLEHNYYAYRKSMKPILIIKTGSTSPTIAARHGDYEDWIISGMQIAEINFVVVAPFMGEPLPREKEFSGVVITGSRFMVTEPEAWTNETIRWLREAVSRPIPILGICYGHQLIAHAMGGKVDYHPKGREIGSVEVTKTLVAEDDLLFRDLPSKFDVYVSHLQSVLRIPPNSKVLASNGFEPHQAFVLNNHVWGVQFHPEFNENIMRESIIEQKDILQNEGYDIPQLISSLRPCPYGKFLLKRFSEIIIEFDKA